MGRRFLECLKKRIERGIGKHVHFVNDVDLKLTVSRRIHYRIAQISYLLDTIVGRSVNFQHVKVGASSNLHTRVTLSAGRDSRTIYAVQRSGENSSYRGLAYAPGSDKKICVRETVTLDGVGKCVCDMLLTHNIVKLLRSPFPRQYFVSHLSVPRMCKSINY